MKTPQSKINIKKILKKSPIAHSQSDSTIIFFPKKVLLSSPGCPLSCHPLIAWVPGPFQLHFLALSQARSHHSPSHHFLTPFK